MSEKKNVTVIGAGIVGICCASYLQRDGHQVTVIDSLPPGEGCSRGNAGLLSPSAVVTPAVPGAWRSIPSWLFDPLGPLAVRWRYTPNLLPWLLVWLKSCGEAQVRTRSEALRTLHAPVFDNYAPLLADAGAADLIQRVGQLYVSRNENGATGSALVQELRKLAGIRMEILDGDELRALEPAVGPQYRSGLFFPDNGHSINSFRLVQVLAAHFQSSGGTVLQRKVNGFELGAGGPSRLLTEAEPLPVETLVIAAGAWSHRLTKQLGTRVPLEAERGYHLMLPNPGVKPRIPVVNRDYNFTITPMENGLRLAGTAEFAGIDAPPDYRRARILLEHAQRTLPGIKGEGAMEWMGARPSLPDHLPIIDRSPRFENVYFAFGHAHFGLTEAPTTGRLIADLVTGRPPALDPTPYRATRFS